MSHEDDDLPPLDDFEEHLKTVQYQKKNEKLEGDITKPNLVHLD